MPSRPCDCRRPALACGGWRTLNTSAAEIKRMYVRPSARGQGLGRRILAALEEDVLGRGPAVRHLRSAEFRGGPAELVLEPLGGASVTSVSSSR
ncbi:GNAT family N-acetyltransferase [Streptomyces sp. NPDC001478]